MRPLQSRVPRMFRSPPPTRAAPADEATSVNEDRRLRGAGDIWRLLISPLLTYTSRGPIGRNESLQPTCNLSVPPSNLRSSRFETHKRKGRVDVSRSPQTAAPCPAESRNRAALSSTTRRCSTLVPTWRGWKSKAALRLESEQSRGRRSMRCDDLDRFVDMIAGHPQVSRSVVRFR